MTAIRKLKSLSCILLFLGFSAGLEAQWQARHNLTPSEYQSTFNDLFKQGYRLKQVSGYVSGGSERYAALWVKEAGPEWQARHGLSAADYQKAFDDFFKQGYRLTWVTGYESGGVVKFAAIWEKTSGPAWQARHNMSAADYQKAFDDFSKQGYRLADVSGYHVGGQDYYTGIWEKTGGPWWWSRNGTPDAWYQNVFDNFYYQGYQPAFISAFTSGGTGKLNSIWTNTSFKGSDLEMISSKITTYMNQNQVPGLALAITKDGRLVYAAGFGYADKESGEEAGPTSLFRIASVSKQFTSAAVMKLIESNNLQLGDKVFGPNSILGSQYPTPAGNQKINQINVKYLLEHVSGLNNDGGDPMFMNTGMDHHQLINWVLNDSAHSMK